MDHAVLETPSDRYMIQQYLAEGGMGAIYLGKKLGVDGFEKEVVLKQLLPEFTSDSKFIDLFLREARISAALDHANIVHTIDLVAAESDFFIVMEYVRGGDLRTLLKRAKRRGKPFPPQVALHVGRCILDALGYAHARLAPDGQALKLIHRDVSPSNILVSGAGEVKLTDFGIAKMATQQSIFFRVKGKIGYMSPEQARGEPLDHRSDLYSLAVCVYEALVGERLFVADMISTPSMIYSQPVPPPTSVRPGLPRELDALMAKALAVKPDDRFQTADELHEAIGRVAFKNGLACSSSEVSTTLREACGDVSQWTDVVDASRPIRTGTAPLTADARGDDDDDGSQRSNVGYTLGEGTQLTSVLGISGARRPGEPESESSAESEPSSDGSEGGESERSSAGAGSAEWEDASTRGFIKQVAQSFVIESERGGARSSTRARAREREDEPTGPYQPAAHGEVPVPSSAVAAGAPAVAAGAPAVAAGAPAVAAGAPAAGGRTTSARSLPMTEPASPAFRPARTITTTAEARRHPPSAAPITAAMRWTIVGGIAFAVIVLGVLLGVVLSGPPDPEVDVDEPAQEHRPVNR